LAIPDVKFAALLPHLNERQRRLYLTTEATALGHGGIGTVARLTEVSESTIVRGRAELANGADPLPRVRRPGGGRKSALPRTICVLVARQRFRVDRHPRTGASSTSTSRSGHRRTGPMSPDGITASPTRETADTHR